MKFAKRSLLLSIVLVIAISAFGYLLWYKTKFSDIYHSTYSLHANKPKVNKEIIRRLKQKALSAKDYISEHGYNPEKCFLLDMKIYSGEKRFFVYNLKKDSIETAGLVTHGSGSDNRTEDLTFSNIKNSNCTSLGKYRIGRDYTGKFGLAYKLYGLDKTNNNAFERFVVLHAHECVPNTEVSPFPICVSLGCPTVAPAFLTKLKTYLDESENPFLLWIYN